TFRANYKDLDFDKRIGGSVAAAARFPDVGLGPRVALVADAGFLRNLQRDYALSKGSTGASLVYTPTPRITITAGPGIELNGLRVFRDAAQAFVGVFGMPAGDTFAVTQRLVFDYDARDDRMSPRSGFQSTSSLEHMDYWPIGSSREDQGHFAKLTQ